MKSFTDNKKPVDSVALSNPRKDTLYLDLTLKIFPLGSDHFNRAGISGIAFILSNQTFKPPPVLFGPYIFIADDYDHYEDDSGKSDSK